MAATTLTDVDLYAADAVEILFPDPSGADRAARSPALSGTLAPAAAGGVARVRPGLVHEMRSILQAMGIEHEERLAPAA